MSYVSDLIKRSLNPVDVANKLGLKMNRSFRAPCPFHSGSDFNMQIYNKTAGGYHCFVCGAHGDVIGLVKGVLNVDYNDAVKYLDKEFNLNVIGSDTAQQAWQSIKIKQECKEVAKKFSKQDEYDHLLDTHRRYHLILKDKPKSWNEMSDEYIEALQNFEMIQYKLDMIEEQMYGG